MLKEASNLVSRQVEHTGKFNQNQKYLKFKVGPINYEELREANSNLNIPKTGDRETYSIILAQAYVGKAHSYIIEEDPDKCNDIKFNQADKVDCYYLCKNNMDIKDSNHHWYILKEAKNMIYLAYIRFTTDGSEVKCIQCNSSSRDLKFCHNDNKYFCENCDEEFHKKSNYNIVKKHKRINYMSFSITHPTMCVDHALKPYDFYCYKCQAVYCIKCLTDGDHKSNTDHQVKYLNDVYNSFEHDIKSVKSFNLVN